MEDCVMNVVIVEVSQRNVGECIRYRRGLLQDFHRWVGRGCERRGRESAIKWVGSALSKMWGKSG